MRIGFLNPRRAVIWVVALLFAETAFAEDVEGVAEEVAAISAGDTAWMLTSFARSLRPTPQRSPVPSSR